MKGCELFITDNYLDASGLFHSENPDFIISDMNFYIKANDTVAKRLSQQMARLAAERGQGMAFVSGGDEVDVYILTPEQVKKVAARGFDAVFFSEKIENRVFTGKKKTTKIFQYALARLIEERTKSQTDVKAVPEAKRSIGPLQHMESRTLTGQMKQDYAFCLKELMKQKRITRGSLKRNLKNNHLRKLS